MSAELASKQEEKGGGGPVRRWEEDGEESYDYHRSYAISSTSAAGTTNVNVQTRSVRRELAHPKDRPGHRQRRPCLSSRKKIREAEEAMYECPGRCLQRWARTTRCCGNSLTVMRSNPNISIP
ncbi:unnamed protein product [Prorocentrum cordatum]|uniref:Uncharacterized protein n=1 Tax=Prorocentrum cordatum TaxID=2364126 RepID=A0ABN9RLF2_9DINO|nr:unnamed protein product [Polarella glacialis]